MSSGLDLDINNYTHDDLENFFKIKNKDYNVADIELKETTIRETLLNSGHVDKKFKNKLMDFLKKGKEKLMIAKMTISREVFNHTTIPKNQQLFSTDYPSSKESALASRHHEVVKRPDTQFLHVQASDYLPGELNPLKTRVISKCLTVDTRFRDNFYTTSSSDFQFQMPIKLHKVVSMQLSSFEIPVSFYGISSSYGNNFLFISVMVNVIKYANLINNTQNAVPIISIIPKSSNEYTTRISPTFVEMVKIITVPDGNYNSQDLIDTINGLVCQKQELNPNSALYPDSPFSYIQFYLDVTNSGSGTGKVSINTSGLYAYVIDSLHLDFTRDINGKVDNSSVSSKIGWNLGYTKQKYDINQDPETKLITINADTIIEPATVRYIYLAIDDFNNSVNDLFITAFNNSLMSPNVLARISIKGSYFSLLMENDLSVVTEPRIYFGPVDLQRIKVQLYDDFGRILDMNGANFSFCLILKLLHDL